MPQSCLPKRLYIWLTIALIHIQILKFSVSSKGAFWPSRTKPIFDVTMKLIIGCNNMKYTINRCCSACPSLMVCSCICIRQGTCEATGMFQCTAANVQKSSKVKDVSKLCGLYSWPALPLASVQHKRGSCDIVRLVEFARELQGRCAWRGT